MDVDRILGELRLERKVIDQRAQDINEAIATFEKLDGARTALPHKGTTRHAKPRATPSPAPHAGTKTDWARARQQYENAGVPVSRIAAAFKVNVGTVYYRIKAEGWKRPAKKVDGE